MSHGALASPPTTSMAGAGSGGAEPWRFEPAMRPTPADTDAIAAPPSTSQAHAQDSAPGLKASEHLRKQWTCDVGICCIPTNQHGSTTANLLSQQLLHTRGGTQAFRARWCPESKDLQPPARPCGAIWRGLSASPTSLEGGRDAGEPQYGIEDVASPGDDKSGGGRPSPRRLLSLSEALRT
eukprot:1135607-Pyramimonas_sp.AAC.1